MVVASGELKGGGRRWASSLLELNVSMATVGTAISGLPNGMNGFPSALVYDGTPNNRVSATLRNTNAICGTPYGMISVVMMISASVTLLGKVCG